MTDTTGCGFCRAPIGADDRLCWSCGEPVSFDEVAPIDEEDLGATIDRSALAALLGAAPDAVAPALVSVAAPAEHDGEAASEEPSTVAMEPEPAEEPAEISEEPLHTDGPASGGFCASCGWSFAGAATAKFCGSCGTPRRGAAAEQEGAVREVSVPVAKSLPRLTAPPTAPPSQPAPAALLADPNWSPDPASLWRSIGPIDRSWSGRVKRGWEITKLSLELMKKQPGLIGIPIAVTSILAVIFILMALITAQMTEAVKIIFWLPTLAVMASVAMTGQAVITQRIAGVIGGTSMTNGEAFNQIKPRLKDICIWGILNATVGIAIRSLTSGKGLIGLVMRIVRVALLVAWTSMTFFVLPVILFEGLSVGPAITRSKQLVRVCWGEGLVGVGILNALFNVAALACIGLAFLCTVAHLWVLAVLIVLATIIGFNLLSAIASPVFTLVMYRYATTGQLALGFSTNELAAAFRRPKAAAR